MKTLFKWLGFPSNVGMGILLLTTVAIEWHAEVHNHDIPGGVVAITLGIFAAKTTHGVMTKGSTDDKN